MASFSPITNFSTALAQGMTSSQATCVLSNITIQGHDISATDYGSFLYITINPGASNMEVVRATTNSSTTFTLDKRGLAWYGESETELSAYKFNHNAGEPVVVSNVKEIYNQMVDKFSDETIAGVKTFSSSPLVPTPTSGETTAAASVAYANALAIAGAPNATIGVKGIVQLATQAQNNAGTATGSTGASLAATPAIASVTVQNAMWTYATDAQASDTYVITLAPAITAYVLGQQFTFKANTANTGAATLNVNGLGAITIKKNHDQDLETGDIEAGSLITVIYDSTGPVFQMTTQQASMPTTALLAESATFFSTTDITGAEAETLSAGTSSDASALHMHKQAVVIGTRDTNAVAGAVTYAHGLGTTPKWTRITATWANGAANRGATCYGTFDGTNTKAVYMNGLGGTYISGNSTTNIITLGPDGTPTTASIAANGTNVTLTWAVQIAGSAEFTIETQA